MAGQGQHPEKGHHWGRVLDNAQWRGPGALHPGQLHGEGGERAQPSARRQEEVGDRGQPSGQVQGEGVDQGRPSVQGLRTEGALPGDRDLSNRRSRFRRMRILRGQWRKRWLRP